MQYAVRLLLYIRVMCIAQTKIVASVGCVSILAASRDAPVIARLYTISAAAAFFFLPLLLLRVGIGCCSICPFASRMVEVKRNLLLLLLLLLF